jgi:hypothetical protein
MSKTKRIYSREFPRSETRSTIAADWVPEGLKRAAQRKAKHEKISLRTVILRHLSAWAGWTPPPESHSGEAGGASR